GQKNIKAMQDMLKDTEKFVHQFTQPPTTAQSKLEELKTNPFRFAPPKSEDPDADIRRAADREKAEALKAGQKLRRQSVIHSDSLRAAMIDNKMYSEGQEIDGLIVEKIAPFRVVIAAPKAHGTYHFELKINK